LTAKKVKSPQPEFPVTGIGASAGGLEAFARLLPAIPPDTGMAFVLVQHLASDHKSLLPEILAGISKIPVTEASDGVVVKPGHIFVNPPGFDMALRHGVLHLTRQESAHGLHHPIDVFFVSLAADLGNRAIGVVLSGTGTDGTLGLAEIKSVGGITLVQSEDSAVYGGMPNSAIAAGCVDFVLAPEKMARELVNIERHFTFAGERRSQGLSRDALDKILALLREATGNDLVHYKPGTVSRQIERRMLLRKCPDIAAYTEILRREPAEAKVLYRDILVNFTRFFRDTEAFDTLKAKVYPRLIQGRPPGAPFRIWSAGCASGEEAYSLAISLLEYMEETGNVFPAQIFASDANEEAVEFARRGLYPESIALNVSPERLRRFFLRLNGQFQVTPQVRNLCVFAKHNVATDPPFSRVDMVVCRNVLIYFGHALQKRVLRLFHYALKPEGFLMLGPSETVGDHADLFALEDKKNRLYACKPSASPHAFTNFSASGFAFPGSAENRPEEHIVPGSIEQLADRVLLEKYAPAAVVVNDRLEINDTLGHAIGDRLLVVAAERLGGCVRDGDTLARIGGDEFVALLRNIDDKPVVAHVAARMVDAMVLPFFVDGHELFVTASIGIALYPGDGDDIDALIRNADTAMYRAKDSGRNNYQFYAAAMNEEAQQRLRLETDLRHATERNELFVLYQPQADISVRRIVGAEALVRWQHPGLGLIPPMEFIPIAEESGLIVQVGEWVLRAVCRQNKAWQDAGLPPVRVAVNLSPLQFRQQDLFAVVSAALKESGLEPQYLELELTESIFMEDIEAAIVTLRQIKNLGVALSIDDFGTGFSSLSYLKRFPIDTLKIDQSFVRDSPGNPDDSAIVEAIIAMAHSLKLKAIAEGVETEQQLAFLRERGCEMMQGYLCARPLAPDQFAEILVTHHRGGQP